MGFSLKKLFLEEDKTNVVEQPNNKIEIKQSPFNSVTVDTDTNQVQVISDKLYQLLRSEDENKQGYFKFLTYLESLKNHISDEKVRYVAALGVAKESAKITSENIINSLERCLAIISNELNEYTNKVQDKLYEVINTKSAKIDELNSLVNEKTNEIEKLRNEIEKHKVDISVAETYMQDTQQECSQAIGNFKSAVEKVSTELNNEKAKIQSVGV